MQDLTKSLIDKKTVQKMAKLSKIFLSDEEGDAYALRLGKIIEMIDDLKEIDCVDLQPVTSVTNMYQRLRKDKVGEMLTAQELFSNVGGSNASLAKEVGCFIVPKVID